MSIVVLRGNNVEIELELVFLIKPPLKSSPNDENVTLVQKRVNIIYLLKSTRHVAELGLWLLWR